MSNAFHLPLVSTFDLSHILKGIAYWVRHPKDLAACVLVNSTWNDAITPVLWH